MTSLKKIQERKLRLVQNRIQNAREHIDEAYEKQTLVIDELIDEVFEPAPNSKVLKEIFRDILSRIFYKRPSKRVIAFIKTIKQFSTDAIVNGTNDFNVYLCGVPERKKIQQNLFYAYLRTAQRSLKPKVITSEEDIWGLDDDA